MSRTQALAVLTALLLLPVPALAAPATTAAPGGGLAVPAPEWTALFDRDSGWTGADGIYSIPLDGEERPGGRGPTFFTFSDTFIGDVAADGSRAPGSTLVNNTNAILAGTAPDPTAIDFSYRTSAAGAALAMVVPRPATGVRTWFWPNDGVVVDGRLFLYSLRMREGGGGAFNFAVDGISLLATPATSRPLFDRYQQTSAPLYRAAAPGRGESYYGLAVLPNTAAAGAPEADGYLYVYGLQNDKYNKRLLVARVAPRQITDFAAYRFWTGRAWSPDIAAASPVTGRLSSEFSVSPLADGRYVLVFQLDGLSAQVAVRYSNTPVGPWSDYEVVYTAPEDTRTPNSYTYNAKAHPHLSTPDRLLISYNVNTFDFAENIADADIYRPRFIWLPLT